MTGTCRKIGFTSTLLAALMMATIASATPMPQPDPPDPNPTIVTSEVVTSCDNVAGVADYQVCYVIIVFDFSIDDNGDVDIGVASVTMEDCGDYEWNSITGSARGAPTINAAAVLTDFKIDATGEMTGNADIATFQDFTVHSTIASEVANTTDTGTTDLALIVTMNPAATSSTLVLGNAISGMKENIAGTFARVTRTGLVSVTGDANAKKDACT